jgi:hypothetical protein
MQQARDRYATQERMDSLLKLFLDLQTSVVNHTGKVLEVVTASSQHPSRKE